MATDILIRGARQHNLKNINLNIPKNKMVVFTGVSGSGKSSLVFDTICAEAQRQLIDTFSAFARQRLPKISQPDVDEIENISTAMVIDQKRMGTTLRSTVGTATEIFTYLRLLYSRVGEPQIGFSNAFSFNNPEGMCAHCQGLGQEMIIDLSKVVNFNKSVNDGAIVHSVYKKGGWFWRQMTKSGFFDPAKAVKDFTEEELHNLLYKEGTHFTGVHQGEEYKASYEGVVTKLKRLFINKEEGSDAYTQFFKYQNCSVCGGSRISEKARSVKVNGTSLSELVFLELPDLMKFAQSLTGETAAPLARRIINNLQNLIDIGVGYLYIHRPVATLSGGESQRVKMARQLDINLVDLMYILDEPSIGLHPKDIEKLIGMLKNLRDKGNSLLVVEHDALIMQHADQIVDIGPEAGSKGGEILFSGSYADLLKTNTITAQYLKNPELHIQNRSSQNSTDQGFFEIRNATTHNLKNIDVSIPKARFVAITGVAGSGKSSLIREEFCSIYPDVILVDQSPAGRSSRSNPLTYLGIFDKVRKEFANHTGKSPSLFSFNSEGACQKCKGLGKLKVEMSFLDEVSMTCDQCYGKRYTDEVLQLKLRGQSIDQILHMTARQAIEFFEDASIIRKLKILERVGLGYLQLGQALSTLSGGEAQRIKLASELHKKGQIYVLDEPTTGLHMADIHRLLDILFHLVSKGNSVLVIEHNLDVIRQADWIIDMGPEGGAKGGEVIAAGTPADLAVHPHSITGRYLQQ